MYSISSLNYITLVYGILRLLVALYTFCLVGMRGYKVIKMPFQIYHQAFLFFMGLWELVRACFFLTPDTDLLPRLTAFVYVPVSLSSITFFFFCFNYAFPQKAKGMEHLMWLTLVPIITIIFTLVPEFNQYFITFTKQIVYVPYREIVVQLHEWFWIHAAFSYVLVIAGAVCMVINLITSNKRRKKIALYSCITAVFFMIVNASQLFIKSTTTVWIIPLFSFISITMVFLLVYVDESQITINLGQKKLLKTLFFPVFFLDKNKKIIYANQLGKKICPNILENRKIVGYKQDIFDHFIPYDGNLQVASNYEDSTILLQSKADGTLYYLLGQSLSEKAKESDYENGEMIMLVAVSFMQKFITRLEDKAFKDSLCGCYNRHYLEIKQSDFNHTDDSVESHLPLSFIMCDIDGLKHVNDTYGHDAGNEYILLCHDIIKSSIRHTDYIFRIGGDEFLVILSNTTREMANKVVDRIEGKIQQVQKHYPTNISVGTTTAEEYPIDYHRCIKTADELMYKKKIQRKQLLGS